MFLSVSTGGYLAELAAVERHFVPFEVCLIFDRDGAIGPLVHYDFLLRKNTPAVTAIPLI